MKKLFIIIFMIFLGLTIHSACLSRNKSKEIVDTKITEALNFCKANNYNTDICILVNFGEKTSTKRLKVIDLNSKKVLNSCKVAHGNTSFEKVEATKDDFSNIENSNKSSLGKYKVGVERYIRSVDKLIDCENLKIPCFELHGLEKSNSNAFKRGILIHPMPISELPIPITGNIWSRGCFSVPIKSYKIIVYGNPKVYHLVIEKCTTFQLSAKLDLIQQTSK